MCDPCFGPSLRPLAAFTAAPSPHGSLLNLQLWISRWPAADWYEVSSTKFRGWAVVGLAGFVGQVNVALSPNNDPQLSSKSSNAGLYIRHHQKVVYLDNLPLLKNPKTATCFFVHDGAAEWKHKKEGNVARRRKMFVRPRVRRARFHHIALKALN